MQEKQPIIAIPGQRCTFTIVFSLQTRPAHLHPGYWQSPLWSPAPFSTQLWCPLSKVWKGLSNITSPKSMSSASMHFWNVLEHCWQTERSASHSNQIVLCPKNLACGSYALMKRPLLSISMTVSWLSHTSLSLNQSASSASDFMLAAKNAYTGHYLHFRCMTSESVNVQHISRSSFSLSAWLPKSKRDVTPTICL